MLEDEELEYMMEYIEGKIGEHGYNWVTTSLDTADGDLTYIKGIYDNIKEQEEDEENIDYYVLEEE